MDEREREQYDAWYAKARNQRLTITAWDVWQARAALAATQATQEPVAYVYEHATYPDDYERSVGFERTGHSKDFVCRPLVYPAPVPETATQAGWISVKDRLPGKGEGVLCAVEFDQPGDWRIKVGGLLPDPDFNEWQVFGASWTPTHWMPLPAAPESSEKEETGHADQG